MTGPGWVEVLPPQPHPKSALVVFLPKVAWVFTPCHGARYTYAQDEAVPGAWLRAVCSDCMKAPRVELQADPTAESGLRALWADDDLDDLPGG